MNKLYFITHPEVNIDPNVPVPKWSLSDVGKKRITKMLSQSWVNNIEIIYSSTEQKAIDGALILADHLNKDVNQIESLGEIDRSSTGFLEGEAFWKVVSEFFNNPNDSVKGWEKAIDAQTRIVETVKMIASKHEGKNIVIISHGAVASLFLAYLKNIRITFELEQPGSGGGNYFVCSIPSLDLISQWQSIDEI
jgi:broad specificity phosphatase PhoE